MPRIVILVTLGLVLVGCATGSNPAPGPPGRDTTPRPEDSSGVDPSDKRSRETRQKSGHSVLTLNRTVLFDTGSARLNRSAWSKLDEVAKFLLRYPNRMVLVVGHADADPIRTESIPSNWELSTLRAVAVVKYIARLPGLDSSRLMAAGAGSHGTVPDTRSRKNNSRRRVEIHLLDVTLPGDTLEVPLR